MSQPQEPSEIIAKELPELLVAGHRMRGRYEEMGKAFKLLGRHAGRHMKGAPLSLYYDGEYREEDADFEPCFPVKKEIHAEGVSCRTLPGGEALTLLHRGPYDTLGGSYQKLFDELKSRCLKAILPTREVFHKGPGMIFKGNPKNYLTEIQILFERLP